MIKCVAFDLDNTLIDFSTMKEMGCMAAAAAMVDAGLEKKVEEVYQGLIKTYWEHGIESDSAFTAYLEKNFGEASPKILAAGIDAYVFTKRAYLKPFPGVIKTLVGFLRRGLKLAVVSDAPRLKAFQRLCAMGLQDFFDTVVAFEDTGEQKPSEKPFRVLLKKLALKPEEVLFVGDNPARDVLGAKKIGMKTALVENKHFTPNCPEETPEYFVKKISELEKIV